MHQGSSAKRGFSGLEMLFTVIVLGIVFTMTLKGQVLVLNIRALMAVYGIQQFQNRVAIYQTERGALPGDDPRAPALFQRENALMLLNGFQVSYVGNARIDGKLSDALSPNGEPFMAWRDLRYAGMVQGDPKVAGASAMPENPFGGVYGFDEGNLGQTEGSLCLTRVPGGAAVIIDQKLDDGVVNTGRVVATSQYDPVDAMNHFDVADSEPYNFEKEYIICAPLMP